MKGDEKPRLRIGYFDHNEAFAEYLPRTGTVVAELRDSNGVGPWYLLQLDEPFGYQLKVGEPYQFRLIHVDAFLVRCRWEDGEVFSDESTAVFILLVEEGKHPKGVTISTDDYVHIAWGTGRCV